MSRNLFGPHGYPGMLVVFEGIGGCGKSTQSEAVADFQRQQGISVTRTREPGGTPLGARLREILLAPEHKDAVDATVQLLLFGADRRIHLNEVVIPALERGELVICDRYFYSTRAYQGAQGGDPTNMEQIIAIATGGIIPDRCYWLDLPAAEALRRRRGRDNSEPDRYDDEKLAFQQALADQYAKQCASSTEMLRLDAMKPTDEIVAEVSRDLIMVALNR